MINKGLRHSIRTALWSVLLLGAAVGAEERPDRISAGQIHDMVSSNALEAISLYREFLSLPNDATSLTR